jgi:hypothetical protein
MNIQDYYKIGQIYLLTVQVLKAPYAAILLY